MQSQIAEQMEEKLQGYEKDSMKFAGKTAVKAGAKIFAFFIVKPTAKGFVAIKDTIADKTEKSNVTVKDLTANGETIKDLEITDENIKAFEPIARKYGIKYSLKEITPSAEQLKQDPKTPQKYMVFFKAKDEAVMRAAITEFSEKQLVKKEKRKVKTPKKDVTKEITKHKKNIDTRPKNPLNKKKEREL